MSFSPINARYTGFDNSVAGLPGTPATVQAAIEALAASAGGGLPPSIITSNIAVYVPSDYPTVRAATLDPALSLIVPGRTVTIWIESGYQWQESLNLQNGEWSHFIIRSVDAEVPVAPGFDLIMFRGISARMPTVAALFDAANAVGGEGANFGGSEVTFLNGAGIKNCWSNGITLRGGWGYLPNTIWTGAARSGNGVALHAIACNIHAADSDVSDSGYYGAEASAGGTLNFRYGLANNCFRYGIRASNSGNVNARQAFANNCGVDGVRSLDGSHVNFRDGTATGAGEHGASCVSGTMDVNAATLSGAINGMQMLGGGHITATNSTGTANIAFNTLTSGGIIYKA